MVTIEGKKQYLRITVLICALAALLTIGAAADRVEYAVTGGNIYFDTETGAVTGCDDSVTVADIPTDIRGVRVIEIGDWAFEYCAELTMVAIPDSVTKIGEWAFFDCKRLMSVVISNNLTQINEGAFEGCESLININIPNSVTYIGKGAFADCVNLTNTKIPNSITFIAHSVFYNCNSLENIIIPDGVTSIVAYSFSNCGIVYAAIPSSVISIGNTAFENCDNLRDIYYSGSKEQWDKIEIVNNRDEVDINNSLLNATIHYNSTGPEEPTLTPAATFGLPSTLTASGGGQITAANVGQLTEISVPVQYSGTEEQSATVAVAFYDGGGRFVGIGTASVTMHNRENAVTVPIDGVSGAVSMKALVWDAEFLPLCGAGRYEIPAA